MANRRPPATGPSTLLDLRTEMATMLARVEAMLAEGALDVPLAQEAGNLSIDRRAHRVLVGDTELRLAPREYALLSYLVAHVGRLVHHEELREIWGLTADDANHRKSIAVHRAGGGSWASRSPSRRPAGSAWPSPGCC